ncbi:MAG: calcium-binding protein [Novosphingobium sp.]|uniref:calcium-binding protein n=1 Tax=Novosphingobium sp. TaxID=1874826 RepID=UPI003016BA05
MAKITKTYDDASNTIKIGSLDDYIWDDYTIYANGGNDVVTTFVDDRVTIYGGDGDDIIEVWGWASGSVYGGNNDDTISHRSESLHPSDPLKLYGGQGDDHIYGLDGEADQLFGEAGNDELNVAEGNTGYGGIGDDRYYMKSGAGKIVEHANEGFDTLISDFTNFKFSDYQNIEAYEKFYNSAGSNYAMTLTGDARDNKAIDTVGGNDTMRMGGGNDLANGGSGNDTLYGEDGNDKLLGDDGTDKLYGGAGDDILTGDRAGVPEKAGNDTLYGEAGNDKLQGNAGDDFLSGGSGDDVLTGDLNADTLYGGDGNDTLYGDQAPGDGTYSQPSAQADKLYGDAGNDNLYGGDGNDYLSGGTGDDILDGGTGSDTLVGGAGNDTYRSVDFAQVGTIVELAGGGTDTLMTHYTVTALTANVENVVIDAPNMMLVDATGNELNNVMTGHGGINMLAGGDGNDTISGAGGNDKLYGGNGNDTVHGDAGDDTVVGGDGYDILYGDIGNDSIQGGAMSDSLYGGTGDDWLAGGAGDDRLTGGAGADKFVFQSLTDSQIGLGIDKINDFTSGRGGDVINVSAIDASTKLLGDQAFAWGGMTYPGAGHAGALWGQHFDANVYGPEFVRVYGDTNGDGTADFCFDVLNVTTLSASDFVL